MVNRSQTENTKEFVETEQIDSENLPKSPDDIGIPREALLRYQKMQKSGLKTSEIVKVKIYSILKFKVLAVLEAFVEKLPDFQNYFK